MLERLALEFMLLPIVTLAWAASAAAMFLVMHYAMKMPLKKAERRSIELATVVGMFVMLYTRIRFGSGTLLIMALFLWGVMSLAYIGCADD